MKFLSSVADSIVDRSPEELVGALMVAAAVAIVTAGLYVLGRRKAPRSPMFVAGLALVAGLSCMVLSAGYIEYTSTNQAARGLWGSSPSFPGWVSSGPGRNQPPGHPGFFGAGWSSGFHIVVAADEDRNGRLTPDEAARLVQTADTDGDGSVDFRDIDRSILSRFQPPVTAAPGRTDRISVAGPPDGFREASPGSSRNEVDERSSLHN